ncbi:MAG: hypothetical protein R3C10_03060 [Pirellulales bacterium]
MQRCIPAVIVAVFSCAGGATHADVTIHATTPMAPPAWALAERRLLDEAAAGCVEFYDRYFDERGFLLCVERWGGDDGPDDAIENVNEWPILHALGAPDVVYDMYKHAWEGHLRQYTLAKTTDVPFAVDGMYYKEFPTMMDWVHNGEGLTVFDLEGLSNPNDDRFQQRVRRFAGFYMNEDPGAPNYDPEHRIIRSLFNGSRGPLLRDATAVDWAGDPIEVEHRFGPLHGERSYAEMLAHFEEYTDVMGDHPQNLLATSLAVNAYMLAGEEKYKDWVLEYVDAWRERMRQNGDVIPTKIGLDGKIGGDDGRWWGMTYGWGFTVTVPQTGEKAHRNTHALALDGFGNALLLTGDQSYVDPWRRQIEAVNAQAKEIDGVMMTPTMYGDDGWYAYQPGPYAHGALQIYYWSMREEDRRRLGDHGWLNFLEGGDPDYPLRALTGDFATLRAKVADMRADPTTPDTRLSDDPMRYNPAVVHNLINLMLGGIDPGHRGAPLHCRLRYFDPVRRRAGIPADVAALVEAMSDDAVTVTLVNTSQLEPRELVAQMGAYGEHQCVAVSDGESRTEVNAPQFAVKLAPGAGVRLVIQQDRYANQPTLLAPWDRE